MIRQRRSTRTLRALGALVAAFALLTSGALPAAAERGHRDHTRSGGFYGGHLDHTRSGGRHAQHERRRHEARRHHAERRHEAKHHAKRHYQAKHHAKRHHEAKHYGSHAYRHGGRDEHGHHARSRRHDVSSHRWYCGPCGRGFRSLGLFHGHLRGTHHVPRSSFAQVIVQVGFGWIFHG